MSGFAFMGIFGGIIFVLAMFAAYGLEKEKKKEAEKVKKKRKRRALKLHRRAKQYNNPYIKL